MLNIYFPKNNLGYGVHSLNMITALHKLNVDLSLNIIGNPQTTPYYDKQLPHELYYYSKYDKNAPSLNIFHNEYLNTVAGSKIITFAIFETDKISDHIKHNLNNIADVILTTTKLHKQILINNGIDENKIHIVHEGIDPELYNSNVERKYIETNKFTYIITGKKERRKNTNLVIKRFIEQMQYEETALIAHTFNPFTSNERNIFNLQQFTDIDIELYGFKQITTDRLYTKYSNGICDIYFTNPMQNITNLKSLYHSANIGLSVSSGEGWGLTLNELLACGIPSITSNCLGHSEYLSGAPTIEQELIIEPIGDSIANDGIWFNGNEGSWSEINKDDISKLIEYTYMNKDKYLKPNKELSEYYINNYNWTLPAAKIKKILNL